MRNSLKRALSPWLVVLAGCGGAAGGPTNGEPSAPAEAKSSLPRDPAASIATSSIQGAVNANNAFALDLYAHQTAADAGSNLLLSPISASLALTMAYAGARGETATQMATALHYGAAAPSIFDGQNALSAALASRAAAALAADQNRAADQESPAPSPDDYQLQVVNSVWGEKTYPWNAPFLDVLARSYGTGVYQEDFIGNYDGARQTINTWVSSQTNDKINNLLAEGTLDPGTRMVLVNAIHVKFPWAAPFEPAQTAPGAFTNGKGASVSPSFMNQTGNFSYVDDGNARSIALPLLGNLTVVVTLPHGDLATYEAGLTTASTALVPPTSEALVALALPKFTFTSASVSLKPALQAMGMTDAYTAGVADFSGLCSGPPDGDKLYVKDVLQKTMLAAQETGVEAAAATAVIIAGAASGKGPAPTPIPMVVNKPFLISIVDQPTGAVLFLGRIEDPTDVGSP